VFAIDLEDEDTDADAIARLLAGAGGIWSAWTPVGDGSGGTCLPFDCCDAQWQQRTTGFTLSYFESQFRCVNTPGTLEPLTNYTIKVQLSRRVQGSSAPFTLYTTLEFPITTDASGDFPSFDGDVTNDVGFDTYVSDSFAVKVIP